MFCIAVVALLACLELVAGQSLIPNMTSFTTAGNYSYTPSKALVWHENSSNAYLMGHCPNQRIV